MREFNGPFTVIIHEKKLVIRGVLDILLYHGKYCFNMESTAFARCYKLEVEQGKSISLEMCDNDIEAPEGYEVIKVHKSGRKHLDKSLH